MNGFALRAAGALLRGLDGIGAWLGFVALRLVLGWEFLEAGLEKWRGENWFVDIQERFPFPFDRVPPELSWHLATGFEIVGGVALILGLGTRFVAVSLFVLTVVAIAAVHWPGDWMGLGDLLQGYVITDMGKGNFKLPVIYLAMLLPLIFAGPGRLSVDGWLRRRLKLQ